MLDRKDKIGFATPEQRWLSLLRPWFDSVLNGLTAATIPAIHIDYPIKEWHSIIGPAFILISAFGAGST
jgi:asparagine synthase (glutamine-hydrolysing)